MDEAQPPSMVTPVKEMCGMVEHEMNFTHIPDTIQAAADLNSSNFVRRSARNPVISHVTRPDVWKLRQKLKNNDDSTVVFKLKDHSISDLTPAVMDMIISDLGENTVCQALYVQNVNEAMGEAQLVALTEVLKRKLIWCLNIGENYQISLDGWTRFCSALPETNVTHLYVSEHTIPLSLKNEMRDHIRSNRKKHTLHNSEDNIPVIERCTNMWWNPMNHFRHKEDKRLTAEQRAAEEAERLELEKKIEAEKRKALELSARKEHGKTQSARKKKRIELVVDPAFAGEKWYFSCVCGEKCSYYEDVRYHPKGAQYECDKCGIWSHIKCSLGKNPINPNEKLYCRPCRTAILRERRHQDSWLPMQCAISASPASGELLNHFEKEEISESDQQCLVEDTCIRTEVVEVIQDIKCLVSTSSESIFGISE